MTDWPVKTLGDVCEIYQPQTIGLKDMMSDGPYVVYGANGPIGRYDRFNHENSEVTVTCRGATCGTVNVTPPQVWITGNAMVVRPNEAEMSKLLLKYWLEGLDYSSVITGAAQPQITRTTLSPMKIPVPPLEEQKRIVALLDAATARVTELTACYEQGRTNANNLFTSALRDALESNPDWPVKTLGEICIGIDRQDPALSGQSEFTYIDLSAVNQMTKQIDDARTLPVNEAPGRARQLVKSGDVLVSTVRPNLNAVALVGSELNGSTASTGFCVLRPNRTIVEPGLLFAWARNQLFIDELTSQAKGASYPAVTDNVVKALEIPVPPLEEQKQIVRRLDLTREKTSEMVAAHDAKLTAAKNLRQSILESAFAGDL